MLSSNLESLWLLLDLLGWHLERVCSRILHLRNRHTVSHRVLLLLAWNEAALTRVERHLLGCTTGHWHISSDTLGHRHVALTHVGRSHTAGHRHRGALLVVIIVWLVGGLGDILLALIVVLIAVVVALVVVAHLVLLGIALVTTVPGLLHRLLWLGGEGLAHSGLCHAGGHERGGTAT